MLFRLLRRIMQLPPETRMFTCHDYLPEGRSDYRWESTVGGQLKDNMRAGHLPPPESNGISYLKIPLNVYDGHAALIIEGTSQRTTLRDARREMEMVMSLQEISDRMEIQQLMIDYSTAIDARCFDDLDDVFIPDAFIDYSALGGAKGSYPEIKEYLKTGLAGFPNYYHMISNADIKLDGDTASSRTICFNPLEIELADGTRQVMFLGLWYVDRHVRTPHGWRIAERREVACYDYNVPGSLAEISAPR